jgi:aspartate-semialdehyde dehydrogenase
MELSVRKIAIVGVTGAVGAEFLSLFSDRPWKIGEIVGLASARSVGSRLRSGSTEIVVKEATSSAFEECEIVFFSAGASRSRDLAPAALAAGAWVIDNSSAFRMNPEVPLVVPEINFDAIQDQHRLIANPNCSAIIMLMAVAPLQRLGRIARLIVSTYQSASGAGAAAMEELREQTQNELSGQPLVPKVMPHPYAFNLFSHNTPIDETGANEEERKVVEESRKILNRPDLGINVTCVRVPVMRAHSESITVEFEEAAPSEEEVREVLRQSPGVRLVDDRETNTFPMPRDATGIDEVLVGRIRRDPSHPRAICLFVAGDQLRKGAALNAVQIAERLIKAGKIEERG